MTILGIETSCDETAAAVIEDGPSTGSGLKILSNIVASSVEMHAKTGGIIPEVAAREQVRCIVPVINEAIKQASNITINNLDALAVTAGPGLIGSLLVGVETARTLAYVWNKPIVPVNHLVAHIYANWLGENNRQHTTKAPEFPAVALVVSGGHTDLVLMKNHAAPATLALSAGGRGEIKWIGGTRDDAAGECFDKCARLLGLGYPGGPAIAAVAAKFDPPNRRTKFEIKLPRPMINEPNFDFSFSGLKTAVVNRVKEQESKRAKINVSELAYEIQEAIADVLVVKALRAAEKFKVKSILLAGGVAANSRLREKFQSSIINHQSSIKLFIPPPSLCTDNAAIVASCAYFNHKPIPWQKIITQPGLPIAGEIPSQTW